MRQETLDYYCLGRGLEIGPGEHPLPLQGRELTYYDMKGAGGTVFGRRTIAGFPVVEGHAEFLSQDFPRGHFDFLASSHVLEHCKRPISTLGHWASVVRAGGFLWLAVPLKDECFDRDRFPVELAHLIADDAQFNAEPHYREYFNRGIDKLTGVALEEKVQWALNTDANIHFHAFNEKSWSELFCHCWKLGWFTVAEVRRNGHEMIYVLKVS